MKSVVVLLSSYNGEQYIKEQIESIFNQKDVDVYLMIRDDGSTDEYSNAIVHAFQKFKAPFSGKIVHIFPEQSAVI